MSRGPKLERIENHDYPTRRIEARVMKDSPFLLIEELVPPDLAMGLARQAFQTGVYQKVRVVNERTGITCDEITREDP